MVRFIEDKERNDFSDETLEKAWKRSGGCCEKCGNSLKKGNPGRKGESCWEEHHKDGDKTNDKPENCQILCWPCHEKTFGPKSLNELVTKFLENNKGKPLRLKIRKNSELNR